MKKAGGYKRRAQQSVEVHCFCLGNGDGFMICCDQCQVWYHGLCVGVSEKVSNDVDQWFCKTCSETRQFAKQLQIYNKITNIETNIDELKAKVDSPSEIVWSESARDSQQVQQEKEEFLSKIRRLETQICELEISSREASKTYKDALNNQSQADKLLESLMQEKEKLSSQLILLQGENQKMTLDVENLFKEKDVILMQLEALKLDKSKLILDLKNLMKEKEAITIQLAAKQAENNELRELQAENAILKDCVKHFQNKSRLSLGNKGAINSLVEAINSLGKKKQ